MTKEDTQTTDSFKMVWEIQGSCCEGPTTLASHRRTAGPEVLCRPGDCHPHPERPAPSHTPGAQHPSTPPTSLCSPSSATPHLPLPSSCAPHWHRSLTQALPFPFYSSVFRPVSQALDSSVPGEGTQVGSKGRGQATIPQKSLNYYLEIIIIPASVC